MARVERKETVVKRTLVPALTFAAASGKGLESDRPVRGFKVFQFPAKMTPIIELMARLTTVVRRIIHEGRNQHTEAHLTGRVRSVTAGAIYNYLRMELYEAGR
jgi:hypothetical protein